MVKKYVRACIDRNREMRGFAELANAQWCILENAKEKRPGWIYECLGANILGAFKMEAYFNHIGLILFDNWEKIERNKSKREKFEKITKKLDLEICDSDPRRVTLELLFRMRDDVAHSKTQVMSEHGVIEEGDIEALRRKKPLTLWESLSTIEFSVRAYEDTESIILEIHEKAGLEFADLMRSGHGYRLKILEEL